MIPESLLKTISRFLLIELIYKFFKTRSLIQSGERLWLLDSKEIERKGYLNHWEMGVTEIIFSSFVGSLSLLLIAQLFPESTFTIYCNSSNFSLIISPALITTNLVLLWIFSIPLTWIAIPRNIEKEKKKIALPCIIYHLGSQGLIPKWFYAIITSIFNAYFAGCTFQGFPLPTKEIFIFLVLSFVVIFMWELFFIAKSIIKVREIYQNNYSKLLLFIKAITIFTLIILCNSIIINVIIGHDFIIKIFNKCSYNERVIVLIFIGFIFHFLFGTYCFIKTSNKKNIILLSSITSFFVPLPGCATLYSSNTYREASPNNVLFSSIIEKIISLPSNIFSFDIFLLLISALIFLVFFSV